MHVALEKPRLRGVSHAVAVWIAAAAAIALYAMSPRGTGVPVLVFGACLTTLFAVSALYHRIDWRPDARQRMRRLDHAAIFLLIAGGYTPVFALVPSSAGGHGALVVMWAGAIFGVVKSLFWVHAPKWLTALVAIGLGWVGAGGVIDRAPVIGNLTAGLLVASGVVYSVGGAVYALKRPDPWPRSFGYHEVFHALVIAASALLVAHVARVVAVVERLQ
jgi:hemolysin III